MIRPAIGRHQKERNSCGKIEGTGKISSIHPVKRKTVPEEDEVDKETKLLSLLISSFLASEINYRRSKYIPS
jgi:hypothetical protein